MSKPVPATAIWALGATQIVGYGSLYYSFSVLAPAIGASLGWSTEWVFGVLTVSLLVGGLVSPFTGRLLDRFGAARMMTLGSALVSLSLILLALAPSPIAFALALVAMEMASTLVLYAAAFAALVQLGGRQAQASITHLTLIAGFASTLFWPLTAVLDAHLGWRTTYLLFAGLNLVVCLPLHFWLSRLPGDQRVDGTAGGQPERQGASAAPGDLRPWLFRLVLAGFALEGLVLAAITLQMVPLLLALDLGAATVMISSVFGPAQVLARLVNMIFGGRLKPTVLAVIAAGALPIALLVLNLSAPHLLGAGLFALLFGLGSGLTSIVSGALPLYLFGRRDYGARQGQISAARQVAAAAAPFAMALAMQHLGAPASVWIWIGLALLPLLLFAIVTAAARETASPLSPAQAAQEPS